VNKAGLIEAITDRVGDKRTASTAVEAVIDTITRSVAKGEKVALSGFGVFEKIDRAPRTARNPATGAAVRLKKTSVPKFRAGSGFKDVVSGAKKVSPLKKAVATTARASGAVTGRVADLAGAAARSAGSPAKKAPARKAAAKKTAASKSTARKTTASKSTASKSTASKSTAKRTSPSKSAAGRTLAKKSPTKSTAAKKSAAGRSLAKKSTAKKTTAKKTTARKSPAKKAGNR